MLFFFFSFGTLSDVGHFTWCREWSLFLVGGMVFTGFVEIVLQRTPDQPTLIRLNVKGNKIVGRVDNVATIVLYIL